MREHITLTLTSNEAWTLSQLLRASLDDFDLVDWWGMKNANAMERIARKLKAAQIPNPVKAET